MSRLARIRLAASPGRLPRPIADRIRALDAQFFPGIGVELDNRYWWVAEENGLFAAYAGLAHAYDDRGYLCRAGVAKSFRGCGIHHRLIRVREAFARRIGWKRMITYTAAENTRSSNNLIAAGYKLYVPDREQEPGNWLHWYKDL